MVMTGTGFFDGESVIEDAFRHERWDEARCLIESALAAMPVGWSPLTETDRFINGAFWDRGEFLAYSRHVRDHGEVKSINWIGPSYSKRWWQLAVINRMQRKHEEAIDCIGRGLQLEPDHPYLWVQRGLILCAMARYDEALFSYQTAESIRVWSADSVKAWALRSRGYVLIELGRLSEAKNAYVRSLELEPDNENAEHELRYVRRLLDTQELERTKYPTTEKPMQAAKNEDTSNDQPRPAEQQRGSTLGELYQALQEGGIEKVSQLMTVNRKKMIPSPQDFLLAWQMGGKELLGALMAHSDGLVGEDDPDPEWNERRWK